MIQMIENMYTGELERYEVQERRYSGSFHYTTRDAVTYLDEADHPSSMIVAGVVVVLGILLLLALFIFLRDEVENIPALIVAILFAMFLAFVFFRGYFKDRRKKTETWVRVPEHMEEFAAMHAQWLSEAPEGDDTLLEDTRLYYCEVQSFVLGNVYLLTEPINGLVFQIHLYDGTSLNSTQFPVGKRFYLQARVDVRMEFMGDKKDETGEYRQAFQRVSYLAYRIIDPEAMNMHGWNWKTLLH